MIERYRSRLTEAQVGRKRSTADDMAERHEALIAIVREQSPMTVRQVYYQAVVRNLVPKTLPGYAKVQNACKKLRENGEIDWEDIVDNSRSVHEAWTFSGPADAIEYIARFYERGLWSEADHSVQVWIEKDALAAVVGSVTEEYDVPLYTARGYSSLSFLKRAANELERKHLPAIIFQLGDHDPSGVDASRAILASLRKFAPDVDLTFERLAVLPQQIRRWNLPSRPTKSSDSRAGSFEGDSVELDAIPPDRLRQIVRDALSPLVPAERIEKAKMLAEQDRERLKSISRKLRQEGARHGRG